eukprot:4694033-Prymnesium_polylepis.1
MGGPAVAACEDEIDTGLGVNRAKYTHIHTRRANGSVGSGRHAPSTTDAPTPTASSAASASSIP